MDIGFNNMKNDTKKTNNCNENGKNFVTGDTHGTYDIKKIHKWYNKALKKYNFDEDKKNNLFILGDWGALWHEKHEPHKFKKDLELQLKYAKKKYQLFVIPGNHENYNLINQLPIVEKFGGKMRKLTPYSPYNPDKYYGDIYLLERGEIYTINGQKILALGGALSQDRSLRTLNVDYWEEELWSIQEEYNCLDNLDKHNWNVDIVLSHTCPSFVGNYYLHKLHGNNFNIFGKNNGKTKEPTSVFFEHLIKEGLEFKEWHFGHWHDDFLFSFSKDEINKLILNDKDFHENKNFAFAEIKTNEHIYKFQCHYLKAPHLIN